MGAVLSTLFLGAVLGSIYSLSAFGLVLTYRTSGVFNFAQGAMGMFFSYVYFQLVQGGKMNLIVGNWTQTWSLPTWVGLPLVVLVLAPAFGWFLEVVLFRKLRDAGSTVQIVATIGLLISLFGIAGVVWGSATTLSPQSIFSEHAFTIGTFRATIHQVITVGLVIAIAAGLLAFLRFSMLGIRMRAVVDRPEVSELMGVDSRRVAASAWAIATGFAALAGILVVPFYGSLDTLTLTLLVVAATAAAVVGRLESLVLTLAGGLGVGVTQLLMQKYAPIEWGPLLRPSIPFLVLFGVLLLPIRWPAPSISVTPKLRPLAERAQTVEQKAIRLAILVAVVVLPAFFLKGVLGTVLGSAWEKQLALVPGMGLIFLSLVILVGYAGQISLCQGALAGLGAFFAAHLVVDWHVPFLLAALIAAVATVPIGAVLAARATRLPALFLGLATLAFGAVMDQWAFTSRGFANGLQGIPFSRTELLQGDRAYYLGGMALFGICALLASNLRRGRIGLALAAMRDTQVGLASVGQSVARLKFVSFCTSAFLAALGGAFLAGARGIATSSDFFTLNSLIFLAIAVVGGISRWPGALVAAALFQLSPAIFHQPVFQENVVFKFLFHGRLEALLPVFFGLGAIGLAQNPHGIVEQTREGFARSREKRAARRQPVPTPAPPDGAAPQPAARRDGALVTAANARLYHLRTCVLNTGKKPVVVTATRARRLQACPVCEPPAPAPARARPRRRPAPKP